MSYALAIAAEGRGDAGTILVLQVLRLLILATALPLLLVAFVMPASQPPTVQTMPPGALFCLSAVVAAVGWLAARRGLPAAFLIAGMGVNGVAHVTGLVEGAAPAWMLFGGFALTGAALGARMTDMPLARVRALGGAAVAVVVLAMAIAGAFAWTTSVLTGLPNGQIWVAYAPGGVEAMAAIGLAMGYDPAFIATHHLFRIGLLVFLLPLALSRTRAG